MVSRTSFMSFRLAPSIARPIGTPCPSVNRLRFAPFFPGQWDSCQYPHHPRALLSLLHPYSTTPSQSLSVRQTVQHLLSTVSKRRPLEPILENGHVRLIQGINPCGRGLSIGNLFALRRRSHLHMCDLGRAACLHQNDVCSHALAASARKQPRVHPIRENSSWFCYWAFLPVYVWLELSQFVRSYTKFTSYSDRL